MNQNVKLKTRMNIAVFIILVFILPISYYCVSPIVKTLGYTLDIDIGEKRSKAKIEAFRNVDEFRQSFERYYNDRIPYRNFMIKINRSLNSILNKKMPIGTTQVVEGDLPFEIDPYVEKYPVIYSETGVVIYGQSDWLFYNDENIMEMYQRKDIADSKYFDELCFEIKKLDEVAMQKGKKIYYLIAPEKQEVYGEYMPSFKIEEKNSFFTEELVKNVKEKTGIGIIYPRDLLKSKKNEYRMYKKYDSHWNQISAHLVAGELYKSMGLTFPDLTTQKITMIEEAGYSGETFDPAHRDLVLLANIDYQNYPTSYEYVVEYQGIKDINNEKLLNKTVCVIGDSFSIDISSKLNLDFDNYTFIHGVDELPNDNGVEKIDQADIIVYEIVERHITNHFLSNIKKIRQRLESE